MRRVGVRARAQVRGVLVRWPGMDTDAHVLYPSRPRDHPHRGARLRTLLNNLIRLVFAGALTLGLAACGSEEGGCTDSYDCPGAQVCVNTVCQEVVCSTDDDCVEPGLRCVGNQCVGGSSSAAPPAGGADASSSPAPAGDASP